MIIIVIGGANYAPRSGSDQLTPNMCSTIVIVIRSSLIAIEARSLHRGSAQRIGRVVNIYIVNIYIYIFIYIYIYIYTHKHTYTGTIGKSWKVCWLSWHGKPLFSPQRHARGAAVVCPLVS